MVRPRMAGPQLPWSLAILVCYLLAFSRCEEGFGIPCLRYMLEKEKREERRGEEERRPALMRSSSRLTAKRRRCWFSLTVYRLESASLSPLRDDANEEIYPTIRSHKHLLLSYSLSYLRDFHLVECAQKRGVT